MAFTVSAMNPASASFAATFARPAALSISGWPAGHGYRASGEAPPPVTRQFGNDPCSSTITAAGRDPAGTAITPFNGTSTTWWLPSHSATCTCRVPRE